MSSEVWQNLYNAIKETRPDLAPEFHGCRNRETIVEFMNKHFPLQNIASPPDWDAQILIRIPEMMKEHGSRKEWKRVEKD